MDFSGINFEHWTGKLLDNSGSGAFLINGDRISGHFSGDFGNFEIYPLGNGLHIFSELDSEQYQECGNEIENFQPTSTQKANPTKEFVTEKSAIGTECFLRLIVGYTSQAKNLTQSNFGRSMNEHIGLAVMESNQGYANSNVESRVELAYSYETSDNETFFSGTDVNALQSKTDRKWNEIHDFRDEYGGDMVCLVANYLLVCGQAFGFDYTDEANMFQVSSYNCIVGNYTFAHEFGHNQGCRHDNDPTTTPFTFAKGYNDGIERTIMAVSSDEPRRNRWSNPDLNFIGGGVSGTVDRDNARALDEGDVIVASHRVTPSSATIDNLIPDDHTLNMVAINSLISTNEIEAGGILELKSQGTIVLEEGFHAQPGSEFKAFIIPACTASYSITDKEAIEKRNVNIETTTTVATLEIAPNPISAFAKLSWQQEEAALVNIQIQNAYGKTVLEVTNERWFNKGNHRLEIRLPDLSNGLYYLVFRTVNQNITQPIVLMK